MFKKLDILLLRAYIGPLIATFFIALFALDMQFFWLYMDDMLGKGFGAWTIIQELVYMSATLVPLALPLAILLSSIMCFGNMGEYYELVAIKSSGISLLRFMRPLFILVVFLAVGGFVFQNNVIPVANLKALSMLYDLQHSKPALNIRPGQFNNDIDGFSIRIGEKEKDGRTIHHIIIYDHLSGGNGNDKVVLADHGIMMPSADKRYLIFRLQDGWRYQEGGLSHSYFTPQQHTEQMRMHFKQWDKVFDLSSFTLNHTDQSLFKGAWQMMDVPQLITTIDSIHKDQKRSFDHNELMVMPYYTTIKTNTQYKGLDTVLKKRNAVATAIVYKKTFADHIPDSLRSKTISTATANTRSLVSQYGIAAIEEDNYDKRLREHGIALYGKFTTPFACILLFLIGAPLGAIIRKGGLGMPLVWAIIFFLFYYVLQILGEKLATTGKLPIGVGMWLSSAVLLPIAITLVYNARNDSQIFNKEWYSRLWDKIGRVLFNRKKRSSEA